MGGAFLTKFSGRPVASTIFFVSRRWAIFRTRHLTQPPTRSRPTGPGYRPKDRNGRLAHVRSSGRLRSEPAVGMTPSHIASTAANGRIRSDAEWIIDPPQVARRPAQVPQYGESLFTRSPSPWILDSTSHILFGSRLTTPNDGTPICRFLPMSRIIGATWCFADSPEKEMPHSSS
jgi:hypothetical protein